MPRYLALALKVAADSRHPKHALGAVVVKGGAVLAKAANSGRRERCAERRALKRGRYAGATIYVARANARCSRPCEACQQAIREAGVKRVVYVDLDGGICDERT